MANATVAVPRLLEHYRREVAPGMQKAFSYSNVMEIPRLQKIVVSIGAKEGQDDIKILEQLAVELGQITGQKPQVTHAKKSIAAFKLRENSPIGLKVTLRRNRMWEFLDRLFNVAMPRIRDFRGYPDTSFDDRGCYTFGIQEQTIFPEVEFDKVKKIKGMNVTFVTSAKNNAETKKLLELLGFPFRKKEKR